MLEISTAERRPVISWLRQRQTKAVTHRPRVLHGSSDRTNQYPYVVSLLTVIESIYLGVCTGSLISKQWVLTADHCLKSPGLEPQFVRCGNRTIPSNETQCKAKILKGISHPSASGGMQSLHDIALLLVEELIMERYGRLHAADYKTLAGRTCKYAGFGSLTYKTANTLNEILEHEKIPLQIGEGVIYLDEEIWVNYASSPQLKVAQKCSKVKQQPLSGDSGGPLLVEARIAGVACMASIKDLGRRPPLIIYTPVSPYINWIRNVMESHGS